MAMTAAIAKFKASQWRDPSWESTIESIELLCGNHPSKSTKLCRWQLWQKHETQCWSFETAAGVGQKGPSSLDPSFRRKAAKFLPFDFLYRTVCFALPHSVRIDLFSYLSHYVQLLLLLLLLFLLLLLLMYLLLRRRWTCLLMYPILHVNVFLSIRYYALTCSSRLCCPKFNFVFSFFLAIVILLVYPVIRFNFLISSNQI
jgi:hypothetical protein